MDKQKIFNLLMLVSDAIDAGHKVNFSFDEIGVHMIDLSPPLDSHGVFAIYPNKAYGSTFEQVEDYLNGLLKMEEVA